MDRADRHLVVVAELLDRVDLLAQRVDADHHLDRVVAQRRRPPEGVRGRLGVDRGGGEADQRAVEAPWLSAASSTTEIWSRRSRITPSRSAHGQISSAVQVEDVHARPRRRARPARSGACGSARRRAGRRARRRDMLHQLGDPLRQRLELEHPRHQRARRHWARRRRCAPASGRSSTSRPRGRARPGRSRWPASRAISARICLRSSRIVVLVGRPPPNHTRAIRAAPERQRPGHVGGLVGAAGDLQRAAADVEDRQPAGRPAEPAAYGQEGQARLVLTGEHLQRDAAVLLDVGEDLVGVDGVADRGGREAEHLLAALVLGDLGRGGAEVGEGLDALLA